MGRKALKQTGDGHFTPIGGFHQQSQRVLVFDTARFKYPPHWIDLDFLYKALCTKDSESSLWRGFLVVSVKFRNNMIHSKMCSTKIDCKAI